MGKRKAIMMMCDNPNCDVEREFFDAPPSGFHFKKGIFVNGGGGGPIPETYACSEECIVPAIKARIAEEW